MANASAAGLARSLAASFPSVCVMLSVQCVCVCADWKSTGCTLTRYYVQGEKGRNRPLCGVGSCCVLQSVFCNIVSMRNVQGKHFVCMDNTYGSDGYGVSYVLRIIITQLLSLYLANACLATFLITS